MYEVIRARKADLSLFPRHLSKPTLPTLPPLVASSFSLRATVSHLTAASHAPSGLRPATGRVQLSDLP